MMNRHFFWVLALTSSLAWADGSLKDVQGDVKVNGKAVAVGAEVLSGATVKTGDKSRATIRFDDGQVIVLGANTEFKVRNYAYNKAEASKDSIVLDLFRGTMRAISGALGQRNPGKFALYTPTATAGIRGTDFIAQVIEYAGQDGVTRQQVFFSVKGGQVEVVTSAGKLVLGRGQAVLTTPSGAIKPLPIESLPADLQQLAAADVSAVSGTGVGTTVGTATGGAAGTAAVAVPVVGVAGAVAGLVAATSNNSTVTGHHGTTSHGSTGHHTNQ